MDILTDMEKLSPFLLRSRALEVGRDRLLQVRNKLLFVLVTEDIADNSLKKVLQQFNCPVFQCFLPKDIAHLFRYHGTKLVGFRRSDLCNKIMEMLEPYRLSCAEGGVLPVRRVPDHPKVAVLGVHGIGKYHAYWWNYEGAEVCAFLSSSTASVEKNTAMLKNMFDFQGRGYASLDELLEKEKPDIIDVCLPDVLHYSAVKKALEAQCHVLCEKPFVFDDRLSDEEMTAEAEELVQLAAKNRVLLGISCQYAVAIRKCLSLRKDQTKNVRYFDGTLISPGRALVYGDLTAWYDLGPHYIAAAQICAREGELLPENMQVQLDDSGVIAKFTWERPGKEQLFRGKITVGFQDNPPTNLRKLRLDDETFLMDGFHNKDGVFQMRITEGARVMECEDMMQLLIRSFLHNRLELPGNIAAKNLKLLLTARKKSENSNVDLKNR